jgi:hypothetical protein
MATTFRPGNHVQQIAAPYRKGYVRAVSRTGINARITVAFTGWHPVTVTPSQIKLI